jgi:hypothetical protein
VLSLQICLAAALSLGAVQDVLAALLTLVVPRRMAQQLSSALQTGADLPGAALVHLGQVAAGFRPTREAVLGAAPAHRAAGGDVGGVTCTDGRTAAQLQRAHDCVSSFTRGTDLVLLLCWQTAAPRVLVWSKDLSLANPTKSASSSAGHTSNRTDAVCVHWR